MVTLASLAAQRAAVVAGPEKVTLTKDFVLALIDIVGPHLVDRTDWEQSQRDAAVASATDATAKRPPTR